MTYYEPIVWGPTGISDIVSRFCYKWWIETNNCKKDKINKHLLEILPTTRVCWWDFWVDKFAFHMIILSYCLFAVASCWHFCLFVFHDCYTTCISIKPGTHKKCNGIEFVLSNLDSYPYYYIQLGETQNISFFPLFSLFHLMLAKRDSSQSSDVIVNPLEIACTASDCFIPYISDIVW